MAPQPDPEVLTANGALRWCPRHQVALTHAKKGGWHWMPFTSWTLRIALAWARYFGCTIRVEVVRCPVCKAEAPHVA